MILSCAKRIVLPKEAEAVYLTDLTDFEEIIIPNPLTYEVRIDGMTFINYEDLKEYVDKYKKERIK